MQLMSFIVLICPPKMIVTTIKKGNMSCFKKTITYTIACQYHTCMDFKIFFVNYNNKTGNEVNHCIFERRKKKEKELGRASISI